MIESQLPVQPLLTPPPARIRCRRTFFSTQSLTNEKVGLHYALHDAEDGIWLRYGDGHRTHAQEGQQPDLRIGIRRGGAGRDIGGMQYFAPYLFSAFLSSESDRPILQSFRSGRRPVDIGCHPLSLPSFFSTRPC